MPAPHRPPARPARLASRLLALVVALLVLVPVAATAVPIEDFSGYEPQTNCSPDAKPGATKLSVWLQATYPGSGSLGISRSCKDGGVSEHKEGRAFDWAVSVYSPRDRAYVAAFLARLFATDAEGNADALARRMGIMYLIWNDQIYSSYYGFRARPYQACKVLSTCGDTLRHRNHVHISLSRAGGNGLTSWYTGATDVPAVPTAPTVPVTPPTTPVTPTTPAPPTVPAVPLVPRTKAGVLDLRKRPFVTVAVPVNGTTRRTPFKLRRGIAYKVTAAGVYGYGTAAQVADASCRWSPTSRRWMPAPTRAGRKAHGALDLLVNGRAVAAGCHSSHVYTRTVKLKRTGALALRVANRPAGASGSLTVLVSRRTTNVSSGLPQAPGLAAAPTATAARAGAGLQTETVSVPAASGTVWTAGAVQQGVTYRVTTSGTAGLGGGVQTDGRCVASAGAWSSRVSLDRTHPDQAHGGLYVDGVPFAGTAADGGALCATRTHVATWTATRTAQVELALWDPLTRADDTGAVVVTVQRLDPVATPTAAPAATPAATAPWTQRSDSVTVSTGQPTGTDSAMRVKAGQTVTLTARGSYASGAVQADAACVATGAGWAPYDPQVLGGQEPLELWVDGQRVEWHPLTGTTPCAADHAYSTAFTAAKNGPLRLAVLDVDHGDNTGTLAVTLSR
ncbi:hypothetical protein KRR39_20920 [Nocardioides panacis]|uniref:ARB-07466-like C-terminal domain-containing protein n=1 Tax=Nocardioides panacis TaxID=2849501 RepID=A0A975XZV3_9ACTN|nr:hypothetical protein [Nocardioides panacis]QWZ07822.1 hypothetical protein KRR39_20920 [Nocardioides panacis]